MQSQQYVLDAVSTQSSATSQGLMQRLFAFYFDAFVYNQIWEDPRVDLTALELDSDSRVLTISSGGCNALNYLVETPASVTAVDLNRYHIFLLRLKLAALRNLPDHDSFFRFFGKGKDPENIQNYRLHIEPNLDEETRTFWNGNGPIGRLLHGPRITYFQNGGLYERSRNGYFLRFFHRFAHLVGLHPEKVLEARSIAEQEKYFDENIAPFFDSIVIKTLGRMPITMFGLGIPPQQLEELKQDVESGSLIDIYRTRAKRLACGFPIEDNYFAWQAFARKYDTDGRVAIPSYLQEANFAAVKEGANHVRTAIGSVTDEIRNNPIGTFDRFVFLDAQDWMDAATMTDLWQQIADRGDAGSRIIFRTAAAKSPLDRNLPPELLDRFEYERELSAELFTKDRASIYGGFHLYKLKK